MEAEVTGWAPVLPETVPFQLTVGAIASERDVAIFMGIIVLLWQS